MTALLPKEVLAILFRVRVADVRVVTHPDTQLERSTPWLCGASLVARFS